MNCREWQLATRSSAVTLDYSQLTYSRVPAFRMLSTGVSFGSSARSSRLRSPAPLDPSSPTSSVFAGLDDELRDARRVLSQGQEEDLRYALDRVLSKVEELVSLRPTSFCSDDLSIDLGPVSLCSLPFLKQPSRPGRN